MSKTISNIVKTGLRTRSAVLDNIQFTNINISDGQGATLRRTRSEAPWKTASSEPQIMSDSAFAVSGIDIDWNGAVLPNGNLENSSSLTINTTGELLNLINEMQKEIYALSAAVIALAK